MKSIVITGSSRGIGLGLAKSFLRLGASVTLNGRSVGPLEETAERLRSEYGADRVAFESGDVTSTDDLERLWETAARSFGRVDVWINNAGVGHPMKMIWELPEATMDRVIDIDLKGAILGSRVAIRHMIDQGSGHVYNMEGFGSNGRVRAGLTVYGAAKSAVRFLRRSLEQEVKGTPVKASALSPGMVITDFILDQYRDEPDELERVKPIFNIIADRVETVTPWLAKQMLQNDRSGRLINWLTGPKLFWRFATAWIRKRDLFSDHTP